MLKFSFKWFFLSALTAGILAACGVGETTDDTDEPDVEQVEVEDEDDE